MFAMFVQSNIPREKIGVFDKYLIESSKNGDIEIVQIMIEKDVVKLDEALFNACQNGYIEIAKLLIKRGATNFNDGLVAACRNSKEYVEIAKLMIENGATDLNNCLHYACKDGHANMVELLLEKGATNLDECLNIMRTKTDPHDKITQLLTKYSDLAKAKSETSD